MKHLVAVLFAVLSLNAFSQIPDYVPADGLVAWYPFDGNAHDESGNGFDGEAIGATLTADRNGIPNSSYYFDWANVSGYGSAWHRIEVNPTFSDAVENTMSITAWINLENYWWPNNSIHTAMIAGSAARCPNPMNFRFKVKEQGQLALNFGTNFITTEENVIELNTWHHVAATVGQDSMTLYVDGVEVARGGATYFDMTGCLTFGEHHQGNGHWYYFDGAIDDLSIHSRELGPAEILGMVNELPLVEGCTDPLACNFDSAANSDDGTCVPSGCMDAQACNYNADAECEGEACDYTCCPGPGCCSEGMFWDWDSLACYVSKPADINMDGCVQLNDLLDLLSAYGDCAAAEWTCGDPLEYQGYDYETVLIGEQCWFAENVRYLPSVSPADLGSEDDGLPHAYVTGYSGTDIYEAASTENHLTYGALYNFAAVIQWQLCPSGWHVPSDGDWASSLDAPNWNGTELRSLTWNGTNQSGFNALPGGFRDTGGFFNESSGADFWTSTEFDASFAERRYILTTSEALEGTNDPRWKSHAFSVRCMKDAE